MCFGPGNEAELDGMLEDSELASSEASLHG